MKFPSLNELNVLAGKHENENLKWAGYLKKANPHKLDEVFHQLHAEAFEAFDCLQCGNCCRTIGPMVTNTDAGRLALAMRMKPSLFVEKYLLQEPDGTYIFKSKPCPFIAEDNYCHVYRDRPRACAGYPHTDRRRMGQIIDLCVKNTFTCPVVYAIFDKLRTFPGLI